MLNTITTKVEAILSSRPLCRDLTVELNYLTPSHFLIGGSLLDTPVSETTIVTLPQRYKLIRQIIDSFWVTWKKAYLILLQTRSKWQSKLANIEIDDVIILQESHTSVLEWPLARVTQVFTGEDGAV